jgi:hypothetical protein
LHPAATTRPRLRRHPIPTISSATAGPAQLRHRP